jgi:acetate---CoA ligase (ADP-forming)
MTERTASSSTGTAPGDPVPAQPAGPPAEREPDRARAHPAGPPAEPAPDRARAHPAGPPAEPEAHRGRAHPAGPPADREPAQARAHPRPLAAQHEADRARAHPRPLAAERGPDASALTAMLEARSVALVGASPRPGSFGQRMVEEVTRSPARPEVHLVNPRYAEIGGRRCVPSLADLPGPVDLVLLAVPDAALEEQLTLAARRGDRSAVIFGNAHEDHSPHPDPSRRFGVTAASPGHPGASPAPHSGPNTHSGLFPAGPGPFGANPTTHSHPTANTGITGPDANDPARSWVYGSMASRPYAGTPIQDPQCAGAQAWAPAGEPAGLPGPEGPVGSSGPLRERLAAVARSAGMQLCGAGCMGFVNVARGLRAIGYTEPDPPPAGPVALVTHSGSVFSALLRARRGIGYTLAVSSGQELVTTAAAYLDYALGLPETKVLALVLEAIREPDRLRRVLARAAGRDIPVVLLTVGRSAGGRSMVAAHSGALAADDGGWEALARAYGAHRVRDLAELADAVELFAIGRRAARRPARDGGIATVHDSGLERAHAADLAEDTGVPFAEIGEATKARLAQILDPGLIPANPLDVWGTGAGTRELFSRSLITLAEDPSVAAVALAVDLVRELDGDDSYPLAALDAAAQTTKPLVVLGNLAAAVDQEAAGLLRRHGIPVLEGLRPGLLALRHLLAHAARPPAVAPDPAVPAALDSPSAAGAVPRPAATGQRADRRDRDAALPASGQRARRRDRGAALLASGSASGEPLLSLLREYGIATAAAAEASDAGGALAAAGALGYPVVLKTADPAIAHKSDAGGVILGIGGPADLARAYADLSARLGPRVLVCQGVPPGPELAIGIARDPDLGPLIVVGAGGVLVELLADRAVALPPVDEDTARQMIGELRVGRLLAGVRGAPPCDVSAVVRCITGLSELALDLAGQIEALDVNPVICGPGGAVAVDVLAVPRGGG